MYYTMKLEKLLLSQYIRMKIFIDYLEKENITKNLYNTALLGAIVLCIVFIITLKIAINILIFM